MFGRWQPVAVESGYLHIITLLRAVSDRFKNVTCVLGDELFQLPYTTRAGNAHVALWLKNSHAIVYVAHDDDLPLCGSARDVWARAVPVHVEEVDFQRLLAEEAKTHLLVFQDFFHSQKGVARVLLLCDLSHATQDDEVTPAEARHHLAPWLAGLAVVVFWVRAHLLAGFFRFKVVVISLTPSVDEGLTLLQGAAVGPAWLVGFAGALEAGETAGAWQLWATALHALLICLKDLPGLLTVAVAVGEGEAVVGLWLVVPADSLQLTPTVLWVIRGFQTLLRQASGHVLGLGFFGRLWGQHSEWMVDLHWARGVLGRAGVETWVVRLGIVDDQLSNVSDHYIPSHVIGAHDHPLCTHWQLLLPGDLRPGQTCYITQETGCVTHIYSLVSGTADHDRWLRLSRRWDGRLKGSGGRAKSSRLGQRRAGVGPDEVEAAGDNREDDAFGARFCIHVTLVVVGHAIGGTREVGLPLAAVPAFTHRLPVPDVTLGPLLGAHKTGTGGFFRHSHGAFLPIHIACCHTTPTTTHILAALLKGLTLLQEEGEITDAGWCGHVESTLYTQQS